MKRVLLDFSNLRVGGGVQVASATLQELSAPALRERYPWLIDRTAIRISPAVRGHLSIDTATLPGVVEVVETRPTVLAPLKPSRDAFDVRFTLFGPTYTGRLARREIAGFAEVTLVYDPVEYGQAHRARPLRERIGVAIKRRLVGRSDIYVIETDAIAARLTARYGIAPSRIRVVPNRPHPVIRAAKVPARSARVAPGELHLLYPTRAYPHKNLDIIGPTGDLYAARSGRRLVVHTTLRADEWQALSPESRRSMHNHGEVTPGGLAQIYTTVDGVFFPSLLEASSATPLEANVLGVPLIASDRDFVRASAKAQGWFDPANPGSIVDSLLDFEDGIPAAWSRAAGVSQAYRRVLDSSNRTESYLDIIGAELARSS
ncbi:glycosyltransferase [Sphingomonas sp.]|uniref:glycosyltransferase n=1 Tax=Sphingomonas sp. TaxID=28214 RepID=UPI0035BC29A3